MRRLFSCLLLFCLMTAFPAMAAERHQVRYFYENYCEACTPDEDFAEQFHTLTGMSLPDCDYMSYNVVRRSGKEALTDQLASLGLPEARLPLVVVDGVAYQGAGELNAMLPETALSWGGTADSAIVYLYTPACESCARAARVLDQLPASVPVKRGSFSFDSSVTVTRLDASANVGLADTLFTAYRVPDEQRVTPIVFFADRYLSGADAIEKRLASMVTLGWAVGGVKVDAVQADMPVSQPMGWTVSVGAGLVAGLNTCALSMLLLFLSILLEVRRHAAAAAACFLASKFCCYLLIGFVLLGLLQRFDPSWIRPLARTVLTLIGAVLIALNLWDAWQASRMAYGKVRNQLPAGLRKRLHGVIRHLTNGRVLFPSVILLGFVVALGEFLCAGQLYLMRLLNTLQAGTAAVALDLVLYCAAFIAPSALLTVLVLGGRSQQQVSMFFARHMAAAKLITALAMLVLIVTAWVL